MSDLGFLLETQVLKGLAGRYQE